MGEIIYAIVPIITAFLGWVFGKRKSLAEAKSNELDNVEKAIKIWRDLSVQLEQRLTKEIEVLRTENISLKSKLHELEKENENMYKQLNKINIYMNKNGKKGK